MTLPILSAQNTLAWDARGGNITVSAASTLACE